MIPAFYVWFGAQLSASHLERGYSETTDPSVYDTTTTSLSAGVTLRDTMDNDLGLHWDQTQSDQNDATTTARNRWHIWTTIFIYIYIIFTSRAI